MADFEIAFQHLMKDEGFVLSDHKADRGGQTFAGITRKFHPDWAGWKFIDAGTTPATQLVRDFYHVNYWMPSKGDQIVDQKVATVLFSQYANMGGAAIKMVQVVVGVIADGKLGPKSIEAINCMAPEKLLDKLCIAMVARYYAIGMKDKTQRTWWPGWIGRALRVAA